MAKAIPFTAQTLAHLKPRETDYDVYEAGSTGLFLRVRPSGTKSFRWDCRSRGKLITIGRFGDGTGGTITLAQARARLEQLKAKVAAGLDPEGVDGEERPRTVKQLCEVFYRESLLKRRKRPQEALVVLEQKIIPVIGSLPLSAVDTLAARRPTVKVVEAGFPARAAKVLQVTKQLFGFAAEHGFMPNNPAAPLKADSLGIVANKRDRWLTAEELLLVLNAINAAAMEPSVQLGLLFLVLTGLRTNEALTLEWRDVDLESATVTVRPENQKLTLKATRKAKPYTVPLSRPAHLIVEALRWFAPQGCPWVFYSPWSKDKRVGEKALARAMRRLWKPERKAGQEKPCPALSMPRATPHDFRRTLATHVSETLGFPPHVGQLLLGHSLGGLLGSAVATTYDHAKRLNERRAALDAYAAWVGSLT